jgi:hypothetical protein
LSINLVVVVVLLLLLLLLLLFKFRRERISERDPRSSSSLGMSALHGGPLSLDGGGGCPVECRAKRVGVSSGP